jgi:hypothetical protein
MRTQEYFKYEITLKRKRLFTETFSQDLSIKRKTIKKTQPEKKTFKKQDFLFSQGEPKTTLLGKS